MRSGWKLNPGRHFHMVIGHLRVSKLFLSLGITLSALAGYLFFSPEVDCFFWVTACSTLLVCSGSAAMNNYQDRERDKRLARTRNRPLPSGLLLPKTVLSQGILLTLCGFSGFFFTRNPLGSIIAACMGVLLYNGIYTPLKSRTLLAIIPGSMCGMLPPLMGWCAAGGCLFSGAVPVSASPYPSQAGSLFSFMILMGIWQLPHYWLILLIHKTDYANSRLPSMLSILTENQLKKIFLVWIYLYSIMMMPLWFPDLDNRLQWSITVNAVSVQIFFTVAYFIDTRRHYSIEFIFLNISLFGFIVTLMLNQLLFY